MIKSTVTWTNHKFYAEILNTQMRLKCGCVPNNVFTKCTVTSSRMSPSDVYFEQKENLQFQFMIALNPADRTIYCNLQLIAFAWYILRVLLHILLFCRFLTKFHNSGRAAVVLFLQILPRRISRFKYWGSIEAPKFN